MRAEFRECISIAWPLVLSMVGNAVLMFADRFFLARYSAVSVQASLPAGLTAFMVAVFLQQIVAYSGTFVAQHAGAGNRAACARAMAQGLWLSVICIPILLATIPLGNLIFDLSGHAPEVVAEEKIYYLTLIFGDLSVPFAAALTGFFSGRGMTRLVMTATVIGNIFNILIDPLLIWGWGPIPELGIAGAGLATAFSQYLVLAIFIGALIRERHFATSFRRRVAFVWKGSLMLQIMRYGLPSGGHVLLDISTFTIFVFITGRLNALSFAASNIALSINHLIFAPLMGIGMAASVITGQRMGDRDPTGAIRAARNCLLLGWGYVGLCILGIALFREPLLKLLYPTGSDFTYEAYAAVGKQLITVFLAWAAFDTLNLVLGGVLKGAGATRFTLCWIAGTALLFWMPALFICYTLGCGIVTLWLTMLAYVCVAGLGLLVYFLRGSWKTIQLIGH